MALLAAPPVLLSADEADDLDKQVEQIDKSAKESKTPNDVLAEVSRKTGVSTEQLEKQQRETKMGAGSLFIANTLAKETGKSFEEINAARKSGKGWGKIAKENNVKMGTLMSESRKLEKKPKDKSAKGKKSSEEAKNTRETDSNRHADQIENHNDGKESKNPKPEKEKKGKKE